MVWVVHDRDDYDVSSIPIAVYDNEAAAVKHTQSNYLLDYSEMRLKSVFTK